MGFIDELEKRLRGLDDQKLAELARQLPAGELATLVRSTPSVAELFERASRSGSPAKVLIDDVVVGEGTIEFREGGSAQVTRADACRITTGAEVTRVPAAPRKTPLLLHYFRSGKRGRKMTACGRLISRGPISYAENATTVIHAPDACPRCRRAAEADERLAATHAELVAEKETPADSSPVGRDGSDRSALADRGETSAVSIDDELCDAKAKGIEAGWYVPEPPSSRPQLTAAAVERAISEVTDKPPARAKGGLDLEALSNMPPAEVARMLKSSRQSARIAKAIEEEDEEEEPVAAWRELEEEPESERVDDGTTRHDWFFHVPKKHLDATDLPNEEWSAGEWGAEEFIRSGRSGRARRAAASRARHHRAVA